MALTRPAGEWRYEDLLSLPDDGKRFEIIEGVLYEMPAPIWIHALTIRNLMFLLGPVIDALGGWLVTAPVDVFFRGADPVQPDMVVMLPGSAARPVHRGVEGPPDLLIEVLSPSNQGHDLLTKRALYARAGVREYWIVDPDSRTISVLSLERDALHAVYEGVDRGEVVSPLLDETSFPIARIFARLDEIAD